jgi:hypothetical protein
MAGSTGCGRGHGRGHRDRGRGGRDAHSSSPEEEETECPHGKYFELVVLINDDPFGKKKLPDRFAKFLAGREPTEVTLWEAICALCVDFGGLVRREDKIYLHIVWKKFARNHDVNVSCLVNFFYEGDREMSVKVFDNESCRIHYHDNDLGDNNDDDINKEDDDHHDL